MFSNAPPEEGERYAAKISAEKDALQALKNAESRLIEVRGNYKNPETTNISDWDRHTLENCVSSLTTVQKQYRGKISDLLDATINVFKSDVAVYMGRFQSTGQEPIEPER